MISPGSRADRAGPRCGGILPQRAAALRPVRSTRRRRRCVRGVQLFPAVGAHRRCGRQREPAGHRAGRAPDRGPDAGHGDGRDLARRDTLAGGVAGHAGIPAVPGRPVLLRHAAEQPVPVLRRLPRARRVEHRDTLARCRSARVRLAGGGAYARPFRRRIRARAVRDQRRRLAHRDHPGTAAVAAIWLPLLATAAVACRRRRSWGLLVTGAMLAMFTLEGIGVATDQWFGSRADPFSPAASMTMVPAFAAVAVVTGTVLALHLHGIDGRGDVSTTSPVPDAVSDS
jgi:hypothetical protein